MLDGYVVAKLDFVNAFHILHRDAMLQAVADKVPEIYKLTAVFNSFVQQI